MKLSITIVLFSIACYAFSQSNNSTSRSTKIDEKERKRLENQFQSLNTFYIDDDGLVVYQTQDNATPQKEEETQPAKTEQKSSATQKTKPQETKSKEHYLVDEDASESVNTREDKSNHSQTTYSNESQQSAPSKAPFSGVIKKEALRPNDASPNRNVAEKEEPKVIKNSPISIQEPAKAVQTENTVASTNTTPKSTAKGSVFKKNTKPTQYKTMEEAALAVEALLDELRKDQVQNTNAGSMSSRLSGGASRATLRKKPTTNPAYANSNSQSGTSTNSTQIVDESVSEFGYEPTYYINGKEVDKTEVNRLRKKEIISKEVRTRNTASGNPNGEVWYEVKFDN